MVTALGTTRSAVGTILRLTGVAAGISGVWLRWERRREIGDIDAILVLDVGLGRRDRCDSCLATRGASARLEIHHHGAHRPRESCALR